MISLKKLNKDQGFTIIELLIVIVVIGILALLVITTYSGIQQKARNSKRQTDINAIQGQLEAFFSQNGYYPSRDHMNTASWLTTNMKSLDQTALDDPSSPKSQELSATPTAGSYAYAVFAADGTTPCETAETNCAVYTLTATYEGNVNGDTTFAKKSLN